MINKNTALLYVIIPLLLSCSFTPNAATKEGSFMRVEFTTQGGIAYFPALSKPVIIDSSTLSSAAAAQLKQLIAVTQFFSLPARVGTPAPGTADYRSYTLDIEENGQQHTVQLTDPVTDPNLQQLLQFLKEQAALQR